VVDQAGILPPEQMLDLNRKLRRCTRRPERLCVATVDSLEGYDVDDYAYRLGRAWELAEGHE
jgi:uncharacterized protein